MEDIISVIVPVYNSEKYLEVCIESLIKQTYTNLEIIFVNDCSNDGSIKILNKYKAIDSRIRIINNESNQGVSESRNIGIQNAKGKYIGFCDSDDCCNPEMFEVLCHSLILNKADISCCGVNRIRCNNKIVELWKLDDEQVFSSEQALKNWLEGRFIGSSVYSKLFKAELWKNVYFPKGEIFEEAAVIPQLFIKSKRIVHCGRNLYNYYERENSYTTSKFNRKKLVVISRLNDIEKIINNIFPQMKKSFLTYKSKNLVSLKLGLELDKDSLDKEIIDIVDDSFMKIYKTALCNPNISIREKLQIIELRTHFFYFRKKLTRFVRS